MRHLAGVDGCKAGWIAIRKDLATGEISSDVFSSARQLFELTRDCAVVTIDIPMGLTDSGARQCDVMARRRLGAARGSSVFPAPIRPALVAANRKEADAISRLAQGKGVGAQAFGIYARVRDVDEVFRSTARAQECVYEVHPEVCFMELNNGVPLVASKHTFEGNRQRLDMLEAYFGRQGVNCVRQAHPARLAADDDILDAFAALWTAERIHLKTAQVIPDPPEVDPLGLRMGIWY